MARCRAVASAVVRSAQMRAALEYLAGNTDIGLAGVVARLLCCAARVLRRAARAWGGRLMLSRVPVRRPLPGVADHVVEAVAVGRKGGDRRGTCVAVGTRILVRKLALPGISHVLLLQQELLAPRELRAFQAASGGILPLRLGG